MEYLCANEQEGICQTVAMGGAEVLKVEEFRCLGSTVQADGRCTRGIKKQVQSGWNTGKKMCGLLCDRRLPAKVKGKIQRL